MQEENNLENLKKKYKEICEKYDLPLFENLNEDFGIEKIAENETDFLVREIRKFMADKFMNYLRFIESILNPVNVPMFVFSVVKSIGESEKKKLMEVYKKLAKCEVDLIELDLNFSIENEAKFVKEHYELWQEMKKDILEVIDVIKKNWGNKFETNGKNYFG